MRPRPPRDSRADVHLRKELHPSKIDTVGIRQKVDREQRGVLIDVYKK